MAKKINKLRSRASMTMASSAAILMSSLFANQVFAQDDSETISTDLGNVEGFETETVVLPGGDITITPEEAVDDVTEAVETTEEAVTSADPVEEVVVYGIKQSLKNAQDMKRDASTVIDVITASDITSLPDKSVVDALTRVPGVTVEVFEATDDPEHFSAEGSTALVRGLDRTLTQFNGRTSFSASQYGALNLSQIPSELVGAIEVQKNQTASMIAGGIAGTLNVITRKPFDSPDRQLGGSIQLEYTNAAEAYSPSISGLFSDRWETDAGEFGFLVSLAASQTEVQSQTVGTHNYYERSNREDPSDFQGSSVDGIGPPIPGAGAEDVYWLPPSIQARTKTDARDRIGFATSLQWTNPDESITAALEYIRSDGHNTWSEHMLQNKDQLGNQFGNAEVANVLEIPGFSGLNESFDSNGLFTHGVLAGAEYAPETRYYEEDSYVNDLSLDVEWLVNEKLTINGEIQYVDSHTEVKDQTIHTYFDSDVWMDFRETDQPQIGFLGNNFHLLSPVEAAVGAGSFITDANGHYWGGDTSSITDPANIYTRSAMDHDTDSQGDALAFAVDGDYEVEDSWVTNIKAGVRFSTRDQLHKSTEYDWGVISPEWSQDDRRSVADFPEFQELVNFGDGFRGGDAFVDGSVTSFYFPREYWVEDLERFENYYRSLQNPNYDPNLDSDSAGTDDDPTWWYDENDVFYTNESRVVDGKAPGDPFAPYYIFEIEEKKTAAYIQVDFENIDLPMPIRGNVGFRYVDIDVSSRGNRVFDTPAGSWIAPERYGDILVYSPDELTTNDQTLIDLPDDLRAYIDARLVEYDRAEAAGETPSYADPRTTLAWLNGATEAINVEADRYTSVLPSLNLSLNLTDDLLVRFAASKAIYLPHLSLKRASQSLGVSVQAVERTEEELPDDHVDGEAAPFKRVTFNNYTGESISGSNPFLGPEESINVDLGLEWYFSDVGSLAGVVFTKDMKELIRKVSTRLDIVNPSTGEVREVVQADTFNNVGDARINGFELSYQQTYDMLPGIWSGLGVQANFTYLDSKETINGEIDTSVYGTFVDLPLSGLSPRSYNLIAFYENAQFNTRLAYNFRSEYMLNTRDVIGKRPVYNSDRGQLDFSFTYNISDDYKVSFAINNLTNTQTETKYQYTQQDALLHPRNFFVNDRRFSLKISGNF